MGSRTCVGLGSYCSALQGRALHKNGTITLTSLNTLQISSALLFVFGPLETQTIRFQIAHDTYTMRMEVLQFIQIQHCSPTNVSLTVPGNMRHDSNKLLQSTKLLFSFSIPCNECWCCAAPSSAPLLGSRSTQSKARITSKCSSQSHSVSIETIFPLFADCFLC